MKPKRTAAARGNCVSKRYSGYKRYRHTGTDVSRGRGDSDEAGDSTGAETNSGPLLLNTIIEEHPGDTTD